MMIRYFFDSAGETDKQIKTVHVYGRINSSNRHHWKLLKATSIKKWSKKSDSEEIGPFLSLQFFFTIEWVSFELRTFAKTKLNRSTQTNRSKKKANYLTLLGVAVVYFFPSFICLCSDFLSDTIRCDGENKRQMYHEDVNTFRNLNA